MSMTRRIGRRSLLFGFMAGGSALLLAAPAFACTIYKGQLNVKSWNDSPSNPIRGCTTNTPTCTGGEVTAVGANGANGDPIPLVPENPAGVGVEGNDGAMSYCTIPGGLTGSPKGVALVDSLQSATYLLTGQNRYLVVSTDGQTGAEPCTTSAASNYTVTASDGTVSTVFTAGEADNKLPDNVVNSTHGTVTIPYKVIFGNGAYHAYTFSGVPTPNGVLSTNPSAGTWNPGPAAATTRVRTPYLGDCMYPLGPAAGLNTTVDMNPSAAGVNPMTVNSSGTYTTGATGVPFNSSLVPQLTPNDESAVCVSNDVVRSSNGTVLLRSGWFGNQVPVDVY